MDQQELMRRLTAAFLEELQEHVGGMNDALLALERGADEDERADHINVLFRAAHTLKGSSRAVNLEVVEKVCHKVEDILTTVRDGSVRLSPRLFGLLFNVVDALEQAGMQLRDEHDLADSALAKMLPQIEEFMTTPEAETVSEVADVSSRENGNGEAVAAVKTGDDAPSPPTIADSNLAREDESSPAKPSEKKTKDNGPASTTTARSPSRSAALSIRVAAQKLDDLLAQSGELLIARRRVEFRVGEVESLVQRVSQWKREWRGVTESLRQLDRSKNRGSHALSNRALTAIESVAERIRDLEKDLDRLVSNMNSDGRFLGQVCEALEDDVHGVRMFPFEEVCRGLERTVRDVARTTGKEAALEVHGGETEVDRSVLEGLKDPLLHLVRNAVDHGIETPDNREAAGKARQATVRVSVELKGAHVQVAVSDDGRGFDLSRIRKKALASGINVPDKESELARMVFLPGFSTAKSVTDVSGRGVGLDVVQSQIESLHGEIDLSFQQGQGTCFTMLVPLTLTMIRTLMLSEGRTTYAIPTSAVQRIVRFHSSNLERIAGKSALTMGNKPIPVVSLRECLNSADDAKRTDDMLVAVVVGGGASEIGFIVDHVLAEQEVVVQNLGKRVRRSKHVSGSTLLPTGELALVLNVANLIRSGHGLGLVSTTKPKADVRKRARLLVVDDSVTTRTLIKTILETAGYDVTTVNDGKQAIEHLAVSSFDLVVTDVDMPHMNGFDVTETIRKSASLSDIPVILLTSRDSTADKARGIQVGASDYVIKSGFDQTELLQAIGQLL